MPDRAAANTAGIAGACLALLLAAAPAQPLLGQEGPISVKEARASLAGDWRAELQYRDYQSGEWIGIPYSTAIEMAGDGVTQVRISSYDDGPARGVVYITSVAMLAPDGATEYVGTYRADRPAEHNTYRLALAAPQPGIASTPTRWTLISESHSTDDDRPAHIRETTTRDGDMVTTLKEVDFADDDAVEWLTRNRTILRRTGD